MKIKTCLFQKFLGHFKLNWVCKKNVKTVDFSETIAARGLKVGRCRQLSELIKVCEYSRSFSILTLVQGHLYMKIKTCFFSENTGPL